MFKDSLWNGKKDINVSHGHQQANQLKHIKARLMILMLHLN
jgi:hypothetical protein